MFSPEPNRVTAGSRWWCLLRLTPWQSHCLSRTPLFFFFFLSPPSPTSSCFSPSALPLSLPFVLPHFPHFAAFSPSPAAILSWELCAVTVSTSQTRSLEGSVIRIQVRSSKRWIFLFAETLEVRPKKCLFSGSLEAFQSLMCCNWDSTEDPKSLPRNEPAASNAPPF